MSDGSMTGVLIVILAVGGILGGLKLAACGAKMFVDGKILSRTQDGAH